MTKEAIPFCGDGFASRHNGRQAFGKRIADIDYTRYAEFCHRMGHKAKETPRGVWIGPSRGYFNRVPLFETAPPTDEDLLDLFRRYRAVGVHYAAEPGSQGRISHNYFVRDPNYGVNTLNSKGC